MSDLVINVRQIGSYPDLPVADPNALILQQQGGVGGPYVTIGAATLVSTALYNANIGIGFAVPPDAAPGEVFAGPYTLPNGYSLLWNNYWNGSQNIYWESDLAGRLGFNVGLNGWSWELGPVGQPGSVVPFVPMMQLSLAGGLYLPMGTLQVARDPAAAMEVATMGWTGANTVASFNGRRGMVQLWCADVLCALQLASVASEEFVCEAINASILGNIGVGSWNGRTGAVVMIADDITIACTQPLAAPQVNTPPVADRSFRIANTAWVSDILYGPYWQEIQAALGGITTGFAPINSPAFTGTPTTTPPPNADNSSRIPTTNWVRIALSSYAPIISPSFSGLPAAPTANPGTSNAQIATTAFVMAAVTAATTGVISWNNRTGAVTLEASDINDVGGALLASPAFTGTPTAPLAAPGANNAQIASTAWVMTEISALSSGVISWNGRSGIVNLQASDITASGGALLASPTFTGVPAAPTASPGTNTTQLATTQFVTSALNSLAANSVASFNGRTGAVTLTANDVTAAGGLANPSPGLTGTPTAPTAIPGTNTTQIASCAFVQNALANITGIYVGLNPPPTPSAGQGWFNQNDAQLYIWNGLTWVIAVNPPAPNLAPYALLAGAIFTGPVILNANATAALGAVTLQQLQAGYLPLAGGTVTGNLTINGLVTMSTNALFVTTNPGAGTGGIGAGSVMCDYIAFTGVSGIAGAATRFAIGIDTTTNPSYASIPWMPASSPPSPGWLVRTFSVGNNLPILNIWTNPDFSVTSAASLISVGNGTLAWSTAPSDARLKHNLREPDNALQIINALPVYACEFGYPGMDEQFWPFTVTAQDVRDTLGKHAYMDPPDKDGYAGIHPIHLIAVLVRAVQELSDEVKALKRSVH